MTFRQLTLADCLAVAENMREADTACLTALLGACQPETFAHNRWTANGAAWTLWQAGRPVAAFGLAEPNDWSAVAWLVATPEMTRESWRKLLRHARKVRDNALATRLSRIECSVLDTWPRARRFAEQLGFELEGVRRAAGRDGEDVLLFGIIKRPSA